jgi:hypothetical protein
MTHKFNELTLNGHNYPTWAMDIKISLALIGMYEAIVSPTYRQHEWPPTHKYNVLYIIRHHIHHDLKSEYVLEEEPSVL